MAAQHRRQLSHRALLPLIIFPIINAAFLGIIPSKSVLSSFNHLSLSCVDFSRLPSRHPSYYPPWSITDGGSSSSSLFATGSFDSTGVATNDVSWLSPDHLQRLNLRPDQWNEIQTKVTAATIASSTINKLSKEQTIDNNNDSTNTVNDGSARSTSGNIAERNLMYLQEHLALTTQQLQTIVMGYPPVLGLALETNLIPTINYFDDALRGYEKQNDEDADGKDYLKRRLHNDDNDDHHKHQSRLATFLCENPSLIEYNLSKRLIPRLERVREARRGVVDKETRTMKDNGSSVDEDMLCAIATLTDSRFETWLQNISDDNDVNNVDNTANATYSNQRQQQQQQQQYSTNNNQRTPNNPSSYVVLSNLQSGANIGNILRSASIFGCEECIIVGQKRYRLAGDHGSRFDLPQRHMYSHEDAKEYLRGKGVRIYGIEIMENAMPIMRYDRQTRVVKFPFDTTDDNGDGSGDYQCSIKGAAFIFGNEGQGLSLKQKEICDDFIFIPQNRGGTREGGGSASMNVASAAAVVLQAYCTWAGYSDASLEGEKFLAS